MKFKKSVGALLVAAALATSLAACGGDSGSLSQVGQSAANMTPAQIFSASKSSAKQNEELGMQAKVGAVLDATISGKGEGVNMDMDMKMDLDLDLTIKPDPLQMSMNMKADVNAANQQESLVMDMYLVEENGKCAMYANTDGKWTKSVMEIDSDEFRQAKEEMMKSLNTTDFTDAFENDAKVFKNKGVQKLNGRDAVLLEGEITGEEIMDLLKDSSMGEQLSTLGLSASDIQTKSGIKVKAYYDTQTYMPLQMDLDMTDYFKEFFQTMMKSSMPSNSLDIEVNADVKQYTMSVQIVSFGEAVPDVVLPAEAVSAQASGGSTLF